MGYKSQERTEEKRLVWTFI